MNFIRRIGRNEIYIKYVHQLVNVCYEHSPALVAATDFIFFLLCRCIFSRRTLSKQHSR